MFNFLIFDVCLFVFWASQPLGIISWLKTNLNPSLCYSAHKSFNTNHSISVAQVNIFYTLHLNKFFFLCVSELSEVFDAHLIPEPQNAAAANSKDDVARSDVNTHWTSESKAYERRLAYWIGAARLSAIHFSMLFMWTFDQKKVSCTCITANWLDIGVCTSVNHPSSFLDTMPWVQCLKYIYTLSISSCLLLLSHDHFSSGDERGHFP